MQTKRLLLRAGYQSEFEERTADGRDIATVTQDTVVTVEWWAASWWRTVGPVAGFPDCPPIQVEMDPAHMDREHVQELDG